MVDGQQTSLRIVLNEPTNLFDPINGVIENLAMDVAETLVDFNISIVPVGCETD